MSAPELKRSVERTRDGRIAKGHSGNPGGQSSEKRAFLDRMRGEDAEDIYEAMMTLVREGNPAATLRAFEYVAGKPKEQIEITTPALPTLDFSKLTLDQKLELERLMVLASPLNADGLALVQVIDAIP